MSKENTPSFLPPEKPSFYRDDIMALHRKVMAKNQIMVPDLTAADLAIPMQLENKIVGFGFLFFDGQKATLMRIVDPDLQGQGLGHKILEKIEEVARSKGVKKLISQVNGTPSAIKALTQAGFTLTEELSDHRVKFVKDLS